MDSEWDASLWAGGRVDNSKVSGSPKGLKSSNYQLYDVRILDKDGNLKKYIPKEELYRQARESK